MAFLRSPCPPPALDQILASRLPAICPDALHLPRRRHAFRYSLRPQRSRLLGRVPPRVHAGLSPPASPGRRAPLRPNPAGDSPRSRTRTFFRVPPPPYPLQLSFLYSLPDADRHAWRVHPHPFSHSHHARPLRRRRLRPTRRLPRRRSGAYLRHRPRQVRPGPRHPRRKQNHSRLAARPPTPRADFSSWRERREPTASSRRSRRLGRPLRHFAQSASRRAARRRPHPSIRQPARASPHFASSSRDLGFHLIPLLATLLSLCPTCHVQSLPALGPGSSATRGPLRRLAPLRVPRRHPSQAWRPPLVRASRGESRSWGCLGLHSRWLRPHARLPLRLVLVPGNRQRLRGGPGPRLYPLSRRNHPAHAARSHLRIRGNDRGRHRRQRLGHPQKLRPAKLDHADPGRHHCPPQRRAPLSRPSPPRNSRRNGLVTDGLHSPFEFRLGHDRRALGLRRLAVRHLQRR